MPCPPPPQLDHSPTPITISPNHSSEERRFRGRNLASTMAGATPIHVARAQLEFEWNMAAVVVRVIVSIAVVVVPAAPSVIDDGVNEHESPVGSPEQESASVLPAEAEFAVKETVNVADCPAARVALEGDAETIPAFPKPATLSPVPAMAMPKTLPLGVPVLNFVSCFPDAMSK